MKKMKIALCLLFLLSVLMRVPGQGASTGEGPRWLSLNQFSGFLTLQFQVTEEENTSEEVLQYDVFRRFLEGGLQVSTSGSVYHPNFLSFIVDANIVGNRTKDRWISDESIHNSINNTYNIRLNFFRKKKINFQFFTLNNYTTSERRFRGRFFSRHSSTGITVKSRTKILPFSLSLYNSRNSIDALTYSERDEKSKNLDLRVDIAGGTKVNSFLVFKNKNFSESVSDIAYDSVELLLNFRYHYGAGNINNMASTLSFHKMKGNYNFQLLRFAANSLHFFRRNVNLRGTYTLTTDKTFERSIARHELTGMLTHQLFESLTSSVLLGGRLEDASVQRRDVLLGGFMFSYRKKIPTGQVSFIINQRYENSVNKSDGDLQYEIEVFEFSFSDTITLIRPGVNIDTIKVTDPGFSRIYIRDIDYQVNIVNNVVHITRLPGGDIPEDGSVAVHYAYLSFPDYRMRSRFQQINFTLAFLRYFQLYYRKHRNVHDVTSDFVTPLFDSYNRQIVGTRFTYKFLKADYALEDYDSILSDYKANHLRVSLSLQLLKRLRFSGSLSLSHLKYETGPLYNKFNTYSAHLNFTPTPRLDARAVYRKVRYETSDYFRDRESLMFKIRWQFRKIILEAFYEHVFDGYQQDRRLHDFFSLAVRRGFGK